MVAITGLITGALKGAKRTFATILRLVLQKERCIIDIDGVHLII